MKKKPEEIIEDMKVLFEYDNYEEIAYPIIRHYFLDAIGKPENDKYAKLCAEKAYAILAEARK